MRHVTTFYQAGRDSAVVDFCAEVCDCEDCNDAELEECEIRAQRNLDIAEIQGCDADNLDYLDCATRKGDCEDDDYWAGESCMDESEDHYDCRDDRIIDPF
jgi:hypothetical protein